MANRHTQMVFEKLDAKSDAQTVVNQRTNARGINAELQRVRTPQRLHALCTQHTEQSRVANSSQRQAEHSALTSPNSYTKAHQYSSLMAVSKQKLGEAASGVCNLLSFSLSVCSVHANRCINSCAMFRGDGTSGSLYPLAATQVIAV